MEKSLETMGNTCYAPDYVQEQRRNMRKWLGFVVPEYGYSSAVGI